MSDEYLQKAYDGILAINEAQTLEAVKACIDEGVDSSTIMGKLSGAMIEIGNRFDQRKLFLPQVILSAGIMGKANTLVIENLGELAGESKGKVIIGTVEGDVHDLGKNIVAAMLKTVGFEVVDIGKDVPVKQFIDIGREKSAKIIACSALMSTTMPYMKDIVELRDAMAPGLKVMVGGAPVSKEYAEDIGADAYAADAKDAIQAAEALIA